MASIASKLRKDIEKTQPVDDGTVIKFDVYPSIAGISLPPNHTVTYVAVFVGGRWHISGEKDLLGKRKFDHNQFMELLAGDGIHKADTAVSWESVVDEKPLPEVNGPAPFPAAAGISPF